MEPFEGSTRAGAKEKSKYDGDSTRENFIALGGFDSFAFAIDASGRRAG